MRPYAAWPVVGRMSRQQKSRFVGVGPAVIGSRKLVRIRRWAMQEHRSQSLEAGRTRPASYARTTA
jgi:hypothetical protein